MKKTLLLSVVASTMIMAGGDIAPVEPVVEAPAVVEESTWAFGGQAVAFTQTADEYGDGSLFGSDATYAGVGVQLSAVAKDLFAGFGAGVEVSAIKASTGTGGFYASGGNAGTTSGGFSQAYLTYGFGNTSIKAGRQLLPKGLSPFAYSEGWQILKNSFDAALVVNSSIPNTTLVYAAVVNSNGSIGPIMDDASFNKINDNGDVVHMVTAQNKSISNLTLTGSFYFAPDFVLDGNDLSVVWGDAKYNAGSFNVAVQGGQVDPDGLGDTTSAFGGKIGAKFGMFTAAVAYTSVGDGLVPIQNFGGVKSPLYTQMLLNNVGNYHANPGSDFLKVSATAKVLGGKLIVAYGDGQNDTTDQDYTELDIMYKANISENIKGFLAYGYTDQRNGLVDPDSSNFVRVWARYSF